MKKKSNTVDCGIFIILYAEKFISAMFDSVSPFNFFQKCTIGKRFFDSFVHGEGRKGKKRGKRGEKKRDHITVLCATRLDDVGLARKLAEEKEETLFFLLS